MYELNFDSSPGELSQFRIPEEPLYALNSILYLKLFGLFHHLYISVLILKLIHIVVVNDMSHISRFHVTSC